MLTGPNLSPARLAPFFAAALFSLALLAPRDARAQRQPLGPQGGLGGEQTVYGEFKIDESRLGKEAAGATAPRAFVLVLLNESGRVVDRRSVMNGTNYRFLGLRNGVYDLSVESGGLPVARFRFVIDSPRRVELRQDITLAWDAVGKAGPKGNVVSAAEYYERPAATREPFERALVAIKKKKFKDAAALLRQVVEADPKDHLAWAHLGSAYNSLEQPEEAERAYERSLALRPDLHSAAANLGRLYLIGKKNAKAVEVLKAAAAARPDSADVHHLLGEAYLQAGRFDDAIKHFKEALGLDPKGKADAHLRLAALRDAAGDRREAAAELEQFLAKRPDHPNRKQFEQYVKDNKKN